MQAPKDMSFSSPLGVEYWGPLRVVRFLDIASFRVRLRVETLIREQRHWIAMSIAAPSNTLAERAQMVVVHDRALAEFQIIEDAREAA